jgi:hypothetical protein
VAVLAAQALAPGWRLVRDRLPGASAKPVLAAAALALTACAWPGIAGRLPVGSDHGAYSGLDRVIATLRAQPPDAVLYHRWLGWHYDYYLFDAPQERRWWGASWKLADDAARTAEETPERAQWIVLPGWEDWAAGELRTALASRNLTLALQEKVRRPDGSLSFGIYRIAPLRGVDGR